MSALNEALFVGDDVHEREVKLPDGSTHKLHFKELPAVEFRRFRAAEASQDEEEQAGSFAKLIAASLCDEKGKAVLSYQRALKLKPAAANALMGAVLSVNGFGEQSGNA